MAVPYFDGLWRESRPMNTSSFLFSAPGEKRGKKEGEGVGYDDFPPSSYLAGRRREVGRRIKENRERCTAIWIIGKGKGQGRKYGDAFILLSRMEMGGRGAKDVVKTYALSSDLSKKKEKRKPRPLCIIRGR